MGFEDVWARSAIIQKNLVESPFFRQARNIALYSSIRNEVLTDDIFTRARLENKAVCYPKVLRGESKMHFLPVSSLDELSPGAYEIREPGAKGAKGRKSESGARGDEGTIEPDEQPKTEAAIKRFSEFDLIVIPGVAFDITGARLGFGKGFYDRILTEADCPLVALAYDFQLLNFIPTESFDVRMDAIITESRTIKTPKE